MRTDDLGNLLVLARTVNVKRAYYTLDKDILEDTVARLNEPGILSTGAIASVLGVSRYRVRNAIEDKAQEFSKSRGSLNPLHLEMLLYVLAAGSVSQFWLEEMVNNGTSVSTIADLTLLDERQLYRRIHG